MDFLRNLFRSRSDSIAAGNSGEQAVLVYLDGIGLPENVYAKCDLATLEDRLIDVVGRDKLGELDGNKIGQEGAILYMYSKDAERLYARIEATLRASPLCQAARVVIRKGGPGAAQREVRL